MNGLYLMMLVLFTLGGVTQGMNEIGMFDMQVASPDVTAPGSATVTSLHSGASASSTETGAWEIIVMFVKVIGAGVLAMFTIIPLVVSVGTAMGADTGTMLALSAMLQAPITIATLVGLYEVWTGRSVT